ncbi:Major Facilitator Superfamily [Nesidiocoris tenuis]|uniref:Major Facilitator Superfamily n=1 Tax=Nesidiocoris tenuis TaxID=355587 RepID=A0ABN7ALM7_9HEMI|nr:Major Facilitator Superfamily [Nesidiocoris tenuis]
MPYLQKIGARHLQVFLMFCGFFFGYMQRINLSIGIVAMTDPTANPDFPTLNYTTFQKGTVSSVMYLGYMFSGLPAGLWSNKYGPVGMVALIGGILSGLFSASFPYIAIYLGFVPACITRVLIGFSQGVFNPAISSHLSKWIVPKERDNFGWVWSGGHLSMVLTIPLGGILATSSAGWPSVFYIPAILAFGWGLVCFAYGSRTPSEHKWISTEEKRYIENNMPTSMNPEARTVPWWKIITSLPVWAVLFVQFCSNWGLVTLITLTPTYIQGVFGYDVKKSSFLAVVPYVSMFVSSFVFSYLGGTVQKKCGVAFSRKLWTSVGLTGSAVPLLVLALFDLDLIGAMVALGVSCTLHSAALIGYLTNHLDLSPNFCSITQGLGNTLPNLGSVCAPMLAGYIVKDEASVGDWQTVFLISSVIFVAGNLVFLAFGSTAIQRWDNHGSSRSQDKNTNL